MARLIGLALLALVSFFVWIFFGTPIHDFGLWMLERDFAHASIEHPNDSVLLEKKTYLGGQYTHGNSHCVYAVGEMRQSSLTKSEIRDAYQDAFVRFGLERLPLRLIFEDESDGPHDLPFVVWEDELWEAPEATSTFYIVYTFTKSPFLYDRRCDDLGPYSSYQFLF